MKKPYRSGLNVYADVLEACLIPGSEPKNLSYLSRFANVSFVRAKEVVASLEKKGMVSPSAAHEDISGRSRENTVYNISQNGKVFLDGYRKMKEIAPELF